MEANLKFIFAQANRNFYEKDGLFYDNLIIVNKRENLMGIRSKKIYLNSKCIVLYTLLKMINLIFLENS